MAGGIEQKEFYSEWLVTTVLWFVFGMLGMHRVYSRKFGTGIVMLLTFGGF